MTSLFPNLAPKRRPARRAESVDWQPLPGYAVLLALDPSAVATGWGIIEKRGNQLRRIDSGCFHPGKAGMNRYDHLSSLIVWRIKNTTPQITHAAIEVPAGGQWGRSATQLMVYARAIGVCEATCFRRGLATNRVSVTEWKGNKKKSETAVWVRAILGYDEPEENAADALAMGIWFCNRR